MDSSLVCTCHLLVMVSLSGFISSTPIPSTPSDSIKPVPVDFVSILARSVLQESEHYEVLNIPDDPPDWLLHLINEVTESDEFSFSNRQKRQININDPAVQQILQAYRLYCIMHGRSGTVQIRLGRSLRTRTRRSVRGREQSENSRKRRSVRGRQHRIRHASVIKMAKSSLHQRGRHSRMRMYRNPRVRRILRIFYMSQRRFGTHQARFG